MTDFQYTVKESTFNGVGLPPNDKITEATLKDVLELDRIGHCGRHQNIWSMVKRWDRTLASLDPQRCYQLDMGSGVFGHVAVFYYKVPDLLPGSKGATTSSGATAATRGALGIAANIFNGSLYFVAQKVTPAGSYGQGSTYTGLSTSAVSNTAGSLNYVYGQLLLPSGVTAGDLIEINVSCAGQATPGYVQSAFCWAYSSDGA